jgi:hypothetical protein
VRVRFLVDALFGAVGGPLAMPLLLWIARQASLSTGRVVLES